ncbi:MAG: class I SAM-dependent methyltransferase [Candidatus Rokuibacteriota bacterium]
MRTRNLIHGILSRMTGVSFAVCYWDGTRVPYGTRAPEFVLHLLSERVARALLGNLNVAFGEAYMAGAIEVEGDFQQLLRLMFVGGPEITGLSRREKVQLALAAWRQRGSLAQARKNVAIHYDLGNDFFKLWLGNDMAYSCAYFRDPGDDLDTAQAQKFQHICAKLRLRPGDRLLDIGCGWGGFLVHAARHHGIRGVGVTLSPAQKEAADQRVAAHGLSDRVTVRLADYRELSEDGAFDRIVSIGMFEHVGKRHIPDYVRHTRRLLTADGLGVLHTIGRRVAAPANPWLAKYIFPGAYFPTLADVATPLGEGGLHITDVEAWRMQYALTLDRWIEAYEANVDTVRAMYGEPFTRMWRLYLNSCAASFRYGDFCVWQVQFTARLDNDGPLTRDYLYR